MKPTLVLDNFQNSSKIDISKYVWDEIQDAMYDVVNDKKGTAYYLKDNRAVLLEEKQVQLKQ